MAEIQNHRREHKKQQSEGNSIENYLKRIEDKDSVIDFQLLEAKQQSS